MQEAIRTRLLGDGFQLKDLPPNSVNFSFEYDIKSGRVVGRQVAPHDSLDVDLTLARELQFAMGSVFKRGPLDLAAEIRRLVEKGDHIGAAEAVKAGRQGMGFLGVLTRELLDALQKIRVVDLDTDTRHVVRGCRLAVAAQLDHYDEAEIEAQALLDEGLESDQASLENVIAVACVKRGDVETALSIWRRLLKTLENLNPVNRAWIWRNLSKALPNGGEAIRAARLSVDAFLEAGDKREAATTLMHLSRLLEFESPSLAIQGLDDMLGMIAQNGLMDSELRAGIHHARGNRLRELRAHPLALDAALKAVELRREVMGVEEGLISSLYLAAMEANEVGNLELVNKLNAEAQDLEAKTSSIRFKLAHRIEGLLVKFDREVAEAILKDVRATGNMDLIVGAGVAAATCDPDLDATSRLRQLEAILRDIKLRGASKDVERPVLIAIAVTLRDDNQFDRALSMRSPYY